MPATKAAPPPWMPGTSRYRASRCLPSRTGSVKCGRSPSRRDAVGALDRFRETSTIQGRGSGSAFLTEPLRRRAFRFSPCRPACLRAFRGRVGDNPVQKNIAAPVKARIRVTSSLPARGRDDRSSITRLVSHESTSGRRSLQAQSRSCRPKRCQPACWVRSCGTAHARHRGGWPSEAAPPGRRHGGGAAGRRARSAGRGSLATCESSFRHRCGNGETASWTRTSGSSTARAVAGVEA